MNALDQTLLRYIVCNVKSDEKNERTNGQTNKKSNMALQIF